MDHNQGVQTFADSTWLQELRESRAFVRFASLAASVGNFSEIQIRNVEGTGVTVMLYWVLASRTTAGAIQLRRQDASLVTLLSQGTNLNIGEAPALAAVRTAQPAAVDGTLITSFPLQANVPFDRFPHWIVELGEGEGVLFVPDAVNVGLDVELWWTEVPA